MIDFTTGIMRRAMDAAGGDRYADAKALVEQTLARHGLQSHMPDLPASKVSQKPVAAKASGRERFSCAAGSRDYVLHLPAGKPRGVLMMLHGCTQTPEDFAAGTDIVACAGAAGFIVVLPAQSRGDNAQSCWNWFSRADQLRDRGEPAVLAGLAAQIAQAHGIAPGQTFVAGLSAGGAMAVILGLTYSDVFAGVAAHSGLPYSCARSMNEAFCAMAGTPSRHDPISGTAAVPTIVFHGTADTTVAPSNGAQIIADTLGQAVGQQTQIVRTGRENGRHYTQTTTLAPCGAPLAEHWEIDGLGHGWSGGSSAGSYTDTSGPDASAHIIRFFGALCAAEV